MPPASVATDMSVDEPVVSGAAKALDESTNSPQNVAAPMDEDGAPVPTTGSADGHDENDGASGGTVQRDLISGPARSAPSSLIGTGMLAGLIHLIDRCPQLDGSDDSEPVLQVAEHAARMNACPPPAKVLLDCEWMPEELRHTTLDNLLLRVDKSGASRLGLSINFEAGVSWRHADIAYWLHFRGDEQKKLKPESLAGTLTRHSSGQHIEPCNRVMQNAFDSAVCDGLLAANTNLVACDASPLELHPGSEGKLPWCVSKEDKAEVFRIAIIQRNICLCRLSLASVTRVGAGAKSVQNCSCYKIAKSY